MPVLWKIGREVEGAYKILLHKYPENYPEAGREEVKKFSSLLTNSQKTAKQENSPLKKKLALE
jgi:hypothetical protein